MNPGKRERPSVTNQQDFSADDVSKIVAAARIRIKGSPIQLQERLNDAAATYRARVEWEASKMAPSAQRKALTSIADKADKLLNALGLDAHAIQDLDIPATLRIKLESAANIAAENQCGYPELPASTFTVECEEYLDYRGDEALTAAIEGVRRLSHWARQAASGTDQRISNANAEKFLFALSGTPRPEPRHKPNEPLEQLIYSVATAYEEAFAKPPGISRPGTGGQHGGPWLRFLEAAVEHLQPGYTMSALRERWRRMQDTYKAARQIESSGLVD